MFKGVKVIEYILSLIETKVRNIDNDLNIFSGDSLQIIQQNTIVVTKKLDQMSKNSVEHLKQLYQDIIVNISLKIKDIEANLSTITADTIIKDYTQLMTQQYQFIMDENKRNQELAKSLTGLDPIQQAQILQQQIAETQKQIGVYGEKRKTSMKPQKQRIKNIKKSQNIKKRKFNKREKGKYISISKKITNRKKKYL